MTGDHPIRVAMIGNGISPYLAMCAEQLAARGYSIRLVTLGPVGPTPGFESRTRPVPRTLAAAVGAFRSFMRDLREFSPDILYVVYAGGRLGTLALISGHRPLVVNVIGGDVREEQHFGGLGPLDRRTTRRLLSEADLILSKSDLLRRDIERYGDFAAKTHTVRWGVDLGAFRRNPEAAAAVRSRLGIAPETKVLFSPRSLSRLYQVDLIVESLPLIHARVPEAVLLVSEYQADESYAARIRQRVEALGLDPYVRFLGAVRHAEVPALLSAADVMVSVPSSDGLPQTMLEAMAAETPVVSGRLAAYDEIARHDSEALFVDFDARSIADAALRVLLEPDTRARLVRAGLIRAREIADLPREAERVDGLLRGLLRSPPRSSALWPRGVDLATFPFRRSPPGS